MRTHLVDKGLTSLRVSFSTPLKGHGGNKKKMDEAVGTSVCVNLHTLLCARSILMQDDTQSNSTADSDFRYVCCCFD